MFIIILANDFNRDILVKGRTTNGTLIPPTTMDQEWAHFIQTNGLKVITNPIAFTRQGGHNYTSTSHIDGFYSNAPLTSNLQSHTLTNLNQNSDHYPIQLKLAPNTTILKVAITPTNNPRLIYPIPPNNLQNLQTIFLDKQNLAIENLTRLFQNEHLTHTQWEEAQNKLQEINKSLSLCIGQTCMTKPTPPLPNRAKAQGGLLPRIQQKKWKHKLKIYHTTRKAIRAACHHPHIHLHNDPDIQALQLIQTHSIPLLHIDPIELHTWIEEVANIGKNTKPKAHKIITKQTTLNCKAYINKYRNSLNTKPKTIHKRIFHPTTNNSLDCLQNPQGHIINEPKDITKEIYHTQKISFKKQASLCDDTTDHPHTCMYAIHKYPWHTHKDIILEK